MNNTKTVFIIGAGASQEISMPVGIELKLSIIEILNKIKESQSYIDSSYFLDFPNHIKVARDGIYQYCGYDDEKFINCINIIDRIVTTLEFKSSIDDLLYYFKDNPTIQAIGKIVIATAILKAESECSLCISSKNNKKKPILENTWYYSLFSKLTKNATLSEFVERLQNIYFIIFNYDRTLEYYLYNSILNCFNLKYDKVANIIYNMNIFHPYGQLGYLEFQKGIDKNSFGNIQFNNINNLSSMIKTFLINDYNEDENYIKACNFLLEADKVIFLGMAYHKQNIDLLFPEKIQKNNTTHFVDYFGTFYQISQFNQNAIINMIKKKNNRISHFMFVKKHVFIFFNEYSSAITF